MQVALVVVFLRRGFRRNFPLFFAYNIYSVGAAIVTISTFHHFVLNFWVYCATNLIYGTLALLVLQKIFQQVWVFKPAIRSLLVPIWLLFIAALAIWWGMLHPIARGKLAGLFTTYIAFMAGVHWTELGVFVFALLYIGKFTRYQIGILLGFAMASVAEALSYLVHSMFG